MNLTLTVTEQDKKLLLWVCLIGFVVLYITFGFMPAMAGMQQAKADLAEAEALRSEMEYSIDLSVANEQNAANAQSDMNTVSAQFYQMMENDELDTLVTGLELRHNLTPLTLNITSVQPQTLTGYIASARAGESAGAAAQSDADTTDTDLAAAAAGAATDYIYAANISCTASGSRSDMAALLDDLAASYPAVQLTSYNITDSAYISQANGVESTSQISLTLAVYMCNKGASN